MRLFVLLSTFLISALTAHAQLSPQWVHQNPYPTGSLLRDVWYQSSTRIHCVGDAGSIFYSSDGGVNWHTERSGTTQDLYGLCFTGANNGYAVGASGSILRTTDGGQSWFTVPHSTGATLRSVRFRGTQTGLIVGDAGTYQVTVDGGDTWSLNTIPGVSTNLYGSDMRSDSTWIVVGGNNTIMVTNDAGATWNQGFIPLPNGQTLHAVAFANDSVGVAVGNDRTALLTTDGGVTWAYGNTNIAGDLRDLGRTTTGTWVAIGSSGNIIQTSDGLNWSPLSSSTTRGLYGISFLGSAQSGVVIGEGGLVLNTPDAGATWDVRSFGYTTDLRSISFSDKLRGMAVGLNGGTYRTTDGGRTWVPAVVGSATTTHASVFFRDRFIGLLASSDGIRRTTDGGATWSKVSSATGVSSIKLVAQHALAATQSGVILKSTDEGVTWTQQISGTTEPLHALALVDMQFHVVVGESNIHVTTNGGAQWINRGNSGSGSFSGVSFIDRNNGWVISRFGDLLRTTDGGQTFTKTRVEGFHNNILFTDADKGWIVGRDGAILHSTDGGRTWNPQISGTRSDLYGIHFSGPEYGWTAGRSGVILSTIDVRTGPSIAMTVSAPATVNWDRSTRAHEPVRVTAIVTNSGGRPAGESMYTLSIDTTVFELVSPATLVQAGDPSELVHGTSDTLVWDLRAKVLTAVDSLPICVMGSWDNHPEVTACTMTRVAVAEPALVCSLTMPTITWDGAARRYAPRPAPVRVTVRNEGPVAAENVALLAAVPPQLVLTDAAGTPLQAQEQRLDVGSLPIGAAVDTMVWVMHANSTIPLTYPFTLDVLHRDVQVHRCVDSIAIPMVGPIVDVQLSGPVSVVWNRATRTYDPDTLRVTMRARNTGGLRAEASRYLLQFDTLSFDISTTGSNPQVGDPIDLAPGAEAVHMWMLVPKLRASLDSTEICVLATYAYHGDVRSCMTVRVGAVMPAVQCSLDVPTVRWNVDEKRYEPMPATVTLSVRNDGPVAIESIDAVLNIVPAGGLTFTGAPTITGDSTTQRVTLGPIAIGATATATVQVRHDLTDVRRSYDIRSQLVLRGENLADCTAELVIPAANSRPVIIPSGSLRLCEGSTVELDAGAYAAYRWSTGDTTRRITVRGAGSFTVEVPDGQGGWLTSEPVVTVAVPTPTPTLTTIGSTRFCKGDSVIVDAGAGYATYNWSTGERTRSIVVKTTAMVACTVTTPEGCRGWSDTLSVTQLPGIDTSVTVILDKKALLAYPAGYRYQWYKDSQVLKDSVSQFLYPSTPGQYAVEIIDQNGCRKMSAIFKFPIVSTESIPTPAAIEISAYPDPVTDQVTISLRGVLDQVTDLRIVDMLGRTVHAHADVRALRAGGVVVSMAGQSPGTYMILVSTPRSVQVRRIIKR